METNPPSIGAVIATLIAAFITATAQIIAALLGKKNNASNSIEPVIKDQAVSNAIKSQVVEARVNNKASSSWRKNLRSETPDAREEIIAIAAEISRKGSSSRKIQFLGFRGDGDEL
jgi:hypothetical protein